LSSLPSICSLVEAFLVGLPRCFGSQWLMRSS
jgi:hypothetical protein